MLAELAVTVKDAREHVVNFFFDSGSERDHEKATILTLRLNRLWRRQANVRFTLGIVQDVDPPEVAGPVVAAVDAPAYAGLAVAGDLNVVCVRVWDGAGYDPAQSDPFLVFLPDQDCPDGMDLVRAAGVFLGGGPQPACGKARSAAASRRRSPTASTPRAHEEPRRTHRDRHRRRPRDRAGHRERPRRRGRARRGRRHRPRRRRGRSGRA